MILAIWGVAVSLEQCRSMFSDEDDARGKSTVNCVRRQYPPQAGQGPLEQYVALPSRPWAFYGQGIRVDRVGGLRDPAE